jgi:hypothetical protein
MRELNIYLKHRIDGNLITERSHMTLVIDQVKSNREEADRQGKHPIRNPIQEINVYNRALAAERTDADSVRRAAPKNVDLRRAKDEWELDAQW